MTATTPRQRRREATAAEILDAAWDLCRAGGLASLSLRELATAVGLQAPSIYSYFESKNAIYDAMFRQGYEQMDDHMRSVLETRPVTRAALKAGVRRWFDFCTADAVRYQLLFQRTIPGFEPSADSYSLAIDQLERARRVLVEAGVHETGDLDLWTALLTGLTDQQISNDPGGDRWARLLDDSVDMFLNHLGALPNPETESE